MSQPPGAVPTMGGAATTDPDGSGTRGREEESMALASMARRFLGGGGRRPAPRPGPGAGARPAGGASSTDAQIGRAARKGLRRFLR